MSKKIIILILAGIITIFIAIEPTLANRKQNTIIARDPATINNRVDLIRLTKRVNNLESQIRKLSRTSNNIDKNRNSRNNNYPETVDGKIIGRSDPITERLATLLIELKEDVNDIDARLVKLERKIIDN